MTITLKPRRVMAGTAGILLVAGLLVGCGAKQQEKFKDADRGVTNSESADTITMPDGFSNVATKCDHGNRVYVLYHGDAAYGSLAVVPGGCATPASPVG